MLCFTRCALILTIFNTAQGALYVTFPIQGSSCQVLQACQIKWTDDSKSPPTSSLGETAIDLVTGDASNLQTVQRLGGVSNPSVATALTFQPIAGLSPNQPYAIRFTPKATQYSPIFSTFFYITGGSGTASPLPSVTSGSTSDAGSSAGSSAGSFAGSSAGSPSPIVGSQAPKASPSSNGVTQLNTSSSKNSPASAQAANSAVTHAQPLFLATIGIASFFALL